MAITLTGMSSSGDILTLHEGTPESPGVRAAFIFGRGMVQLSDGSIDAAFIESFELTPCNEQFADESEMWEWVATEAGEDWKGPLGAGPGIPPAVEEPALEELGLL